jgi:hypothetical protein
MRNRSDEDPPREDERDRQPRGSAADEPRDFEAQVSDITTDDEGSFFHDSSTDVEIDTHGSER